MGKYKTIAYRISLLIITSVLSWYFTVYLVMVVGYQIATFNKGYSTNPAEQTWNEKLNNRKAEINAYALPRLALVTPFAILFWFLLIKSCLGKNNRN